MNATLKDLLTKIAVDNCLVEETLETRKSNSLDFSDCAVWNIEAALEAAYALGKADGQRNVQHLTATITDLDTVTVTRDSDGKSIEWRRADLDPTVRAEIAAITASEACDEATWG